MALLVPRRLQQLVVACKATAIDGESTRLSLRGHRIPSSVFISEEGGVEMAESGGDSKERGDGIPQAGEQRDSSFLPVAPPFEEF